MPCRLYTFSSLFIFRFYYANITKIKILFISINFPSCHNFISPTVMEQNTSFFLWKCFFLLFFSLPWLFCAAIMYLCIYVNFIPNRMEQSFLHIFVHMQCAFFFCMKKKLIIALHLFNNETLLKSMNKCARPIDIVDR